LVELQRDVHRMAAPDERSTKLVQWLASPLSDVRLTALSIIQAGIADDGQPPEVPIREAMLPLLADPAVAVRRQTVLILQNMNDPGIAKAVLAQLPNETDVVTRATIIKALGRLASLEAVPVLISEVDNPQVEAACVRESVLSLGDIAAKIEDAAVRESIVQSLSARFRKLGPEDTVLRSAVLTAMSGVGDPVFKPEFEEGLNSTNPEILRPAIRGVKALRLVSSAPRLRTLSSDADPLIRSAAIDALGQLGTEDADVECLLARLNPSIETNADVRETAWRAFREVVKRRPVASQLALCQRLPESTDLQLRFLEQFATSLEGQLEHEATLDASYHRMATLLSAKQRYVESSAIFKKLYDLRSKHPNGKSSEAGVLWLASSLRSDRESDSVATITALAAVPENIPSEEILTTVRGYVEDQVAADSERCRKLLDAVRQACPEDANQFWRDLIDLLDVKVRAGSANAKAAQVPAG